MIKTSHEYAALREEMLTARRIQAQAAIGGPAISITYLGVLLGKELPTQLAPLPFLVPVLLLACSLLFVYERRRTIFRAAKYIRIFLEGGLGPGWETRLERFYASWLREPWEQETQERPQGEAREPRRKWLSGTIFVMAMVSHTAIVLIVTVLALFATIWHEDASAWLWLFPLTGAALFLLFALWLCWRNNRMPDRITSCWEEVKCPKRRNARCSPST
jgi:hypothetical protein